MFIHADCGSPLYLDISNGVRFFTAFGIDKNGLKPFHGELRIIDKEIESNFHCVNCEKNVSHKEISARCMFCGFSGCIEDHEFFVLTKSGGIYCLNCCNNYFSDETRTSLKKVFKRVKF